jgi:5-oxoprolinase (ATP-hydrolysing) subunit A
MRVDLNCDMGEGFDDEAIFPHITSANIACGFHAGDASVMMRTLELAARFGVAAGAHPSLPDRENFGRTVMHITPAAAYDLVAYQVGALLGLARGAGVIVAHVKPHGALYNMAVANPELSRAIADAVHDVDASLVLFGLAGSVMITEAERAGLRTASEVFADRGYQDDGSLVPRSQPAALIHDAAEAARRAVRMVAEGVVTSINGSTLQVRAETICVHGDGPTAPAIARALRMALEQEGIRVAAPGPFS